MAQPDCNTAWRAATPPLGHTVELYPRRSPTHFFASPRYVTHVFGEPNSDDDPYKTFHAWDVTDGTSWVHLYNYKERNSFSMRGDAPGATEAALEYIYRNFPGPTAPTLKSG